MSSNKITKLLIFLSAMLLLTNCSSGGGDGAASSGPSLSSAKELSEFRILQPLVTGTVSDGAVAVTIPHGMDVSSLVAEFAIDGVAIAIAGVEQISGTTANDFSSPVTYTLTAEDGTTKDYVVTATVAAAPQVEWYTMIGTAGSDYLESLVATSDGGSLAVGGGNSNIPTLGGNSPILAHGGSSRYNCLLVRMDSAGAVLWHTFLGDGNGTTTCARGVQTSDGGFILAGYGNVNVASLNGQSPLIAHTPGDNDGFVVKLSSTGIVEWFTYLGGNGNQLGYDIVELSDGSFGFAGYLFGSLPTLGGQGPLAAPAGSADFMLVKLTSAGAISWWRALGSTGNDQDPRIVATADGGMAIAGTIEADIATVDSKSPLLAKNGADDDAVLFNIDQNGSVIWWSFYGTDTNEDLLSLTTTRDNGFVLGIIQNDSVTSSTMPGTSVLPQAGDYNSMLVKVDSAGSVEWFTFMGPTTGNSFYAHQVTETAEGNIAVAGFSEDDIANVGGTLPLSNYFGGDDIVIANFSATGQLNWYTFYGDAAGTETARSVVATDDGGFLVGGLFDSNIATLDGVSPLNPYTASNDFAIIKIK